MDRRQFLIGGAIAMSLSALPLAVAGYERSSLRRSLRVAALQLNENPWFWEEGIAFCVSPTAGGPRLVSDQARIAIRVGDRLGLRLVSASKGHYRIACRIGDVDVRQFESPFLGSLLERGEALTAVLSAVDAHSARVDVFLDRPLRRGERVLLPGRVKARLLAPDGGPYRPLQAGWWPVRRLAWHLPHVRFERKRPGSVGSDPYARYTIRSAFNDIRPIPQKRRAIYSDTSWSVFDPGVSLLTQQDRDVAFIGLLDASRAADVLLHDGERVEARVLRPGGVGEVLVEVSLVA